ncbi:VOC family protein [Amycolatopsis acidicola]|uniref:VOC family protein n=1 Tax=Amycolatopsis acidicola TaxID=2596893 RepID=A0A5N0UVJ7_9PSEU|nr:VOC family protein [Amycolatopsis acidicola]KAA9156949.1 VOC family protein [Amycolatopsis acidicola]
MSARVIAVAVDCHEPETLAEFWKAALGYPETERWQDSHGVTYVELKAPGQASLLFQPVPEAKTVKNRLHLDLAPGTGGQREEVERLAALGAELVEDPHDDPWIVLRDPEGNEFCVLPPR